MSKMRDQLDRLVGPKMKKQAEIEKANPRLKSQEFQFYRVGKILKDLKHLLERDPRFEKGYHRAHANIVQSKRGTPYLVCNISGRETVSVSWFGATLTRRFRGFKVFWPFPCYTGDQNKQKFPLICKVHEIGDLPAKSQIEIALREVVEFVLCSRKLTKNHTASAQPDCD